jgi:hypothetical protein
MFGVFVPQLHAQAIVLDNKNNNTKWQDAEATEMGQLLEYQTFIEKGKFGNVPTGYKRIRCHIICNVKHDGQHKACIVAGGHLTDQNTESVYSGVVPLHCIRLNVFFGELNALQL